MRALCLKAIIWFNTFKEEPQMPEPNVKDLMNLMHFGLQRLREKDQDLTRASYPVAFLMTVIGVGVLAKIICNFSKYLQSSYYPMMMLVGFFTGLGYHLSKVPKDELHLSKFGVVNANMYLLVFFPVTLFNSAFAMDYHGFGHSTAQVLLMCIVGCPAQIFLLAAVYKAALGQNNNWSWEVAFFFSILNCIPESDMVIKELNQTQTRVKPLQLLLQGEQLISLAVATYFFTVCFEWFYGDHKNDMFILIIFLYNIAAALSGVAIGVLLDFYFRHMRTSWLPVHISVTIFAAFISFYIGHIFLKQSGVVATITTGVILSPTKIKTAQQVEANITYFWNWLSFIFRTFSMVLPGLLVGLDPTYIKGYEVFVYTLLVYIISKATRLVMYLSAKPLLNMIGHNLSSGDISIIVIGPYRSAPPLLLALIYRQYNPEYGHQVLTYSAMLTLISTIFDTICLTTLLKLLGMYDLTRARAINMKNAIAHVIECRNKTILSLKMDRLLADANWSVVYNATQMGHGNINVRHKHGVAEIKLSEVGRVITHEESASISSQAVTKDMKELEMEARQRILNVQLVSLWKQYEIGILSKRSIRFLSNLIQYIADRGMPKLMVEELELSWAPPKPMKKFKHFIEGCLIRLPQIYSLHPPQKWRVFILKILNIIYYRIITTWFILVDTYFILNMALDKYFPKTISLSSKVLQALDATFYFIFILEFIILIVTLTPSEYFTYRMNQIDFTCNVLVRTIDIIKMIYWAGTDPRTNMFLILSITKFVMLMRLNRLYTILEVLLIKMLNTLDSRMDSVLFNRYDIGKGVLVANDQTLKYLRQIVQDKNINHKLRKEIEEDRKKIARSLGIIQRERPNVAVTIKTRHASKQVINEMNEGIKEIYDEGLLDDIEQKYLRQSIERAKQSLRSMTIILPCSPEYILQDVSWLANEENTAAFLLNHARLYSYGYKDIIIEAGDDPSGIFILVSGIVKCVYKPNNATIKNLNEYGALPNCDFLVSLKLDEPQEDYIVSGNVIGELGAVTGRRFDMSVFCESEVQVYYIPRHCMFKVLFEMENCSRVYTKVWRAIGIKIALLILQYETTFQGWLREKTLLYLDKSFMLLLNDVEEIFINDMVADAILIEGKVMDANTKAVYIAPIHIPRNTHKLLLPGTRRWKEDMVYETRLLILPNKHATEEDIVGPGGILQEYYTEMLGEKRLQSETNFQRHTKKSTHDPKSSKFNTSIATNTLTL